MPTPLAGLGTAISTLPTVQGGHRLVVDAPDWAVTDVDGQAPRDTKRLVAAVAMLLGSLGLLLVTILVDLPGENRPSSNIELVRAATQSVQATGKALSGAQAEVDRAAAGLAGAKQALSTARGSTSATAAAVRRARARVSAADSVLSRAKEHLKLATSQHLTATDLLSRVLQPARTSDADLVRAFTVGAAALIALLGAVAVMVPRPQQRLHYSLGAVSGDEDHRGPPTGGAAGGPPAKGAQTVPHGLADPPVVTESRAYPLHKSEPVWTQAVLLTGVIAAGVFGINANGGLMEQLINFGLPVAPLVGAFFARRRVVPLVKLGL